eukprot:TRINITY_DN2346_c0_g1_i20.p1 TRINITY_DN2346_c0_g1~~TRINITY_DN2346_c0_g1_i20.p1  ORF type:complete len:153 (+),score=19.83 TRINITY_DN2346_c0_g1_i20:361-819(+)
MLVGSSASPLTSTPEKRQKIELPSPVSSPVVVPVVPAEAFVPVVQTAADLDHVCTVPPAIEVTVIPADPEASPPEIESNRTHQNNRANVTLNEFIGQTTALSQACAERTRNILHDLEQLESLQVRILLTNFEVLAMESPGYHQLEKSRATEE